MKLHHITRDHEAETIAEATPSEEHHPSCRESDKDLVWHCSQCGLNESAADIEAQLLAEREKVEELTQQNKTFRAAQKACEDCDGPTMAEVQQLREQLEFERESHAKDLLAKQTRIEIFQQQLAALRAGSSSELEAEREKVKRQVTQCKREGE